MRRGPSVRQLLLGVNLFILLIPIALVVLLQLLDVYLIRQTEGRLIGESAVIAEAWREHLLDAGAPDVPTSFRPPGQTEERYTPYRAVLGSGYDVLPPEPDPQRSRPSADRPEDRAGAAIVPLLQRAQVFNLSGVRVLDADGCVVASSRGGPGACLDTLPEVSTALDGRYAAVVRQRISDEPPPPLTGIRRRGTLRVFTATPVFLDQRVVGVVRMSRTALSPLEMLWTHRRSVLLLVAICLIVTPLVSVFLSLAISRPLRRLTRVAERARRGERQPRFESRGLAPREVLQLGDALERMTTELAQRENFVREFADAVGHELKTPLTGIRGAVELLADDWERMTDDARRQFLANIERDAARMQRLVGELLDLARVESDRGDSEEIEVGPFFEALADPHRKRVRLALDEAPARYRISAAHLELAVGNLLDNALRHGADLPVDVAVSADGDRLLVRVSDRGPGIDAGHRPRIFDRFYTTERDRGGTGLGLAIVRAVAERRGGRVDFETGEGGTTFRLVV